MDVNPEDHSPLAWVVLNDFINENGQPIEFRDHRFLIDPYNDLSPDLVCIKSAQIGFSVMAILKVFWLNAKHQVNVGYVLPTQNIVSDFVAPKVNPLISRNPTIAKLVTDSSKSLKKIGDFFTYFRGAFSEREAIAISLDVLILDELDRMSDMGIVNTYDSRLQASKHGWRWRFSNPSIPGYGVHELWQNSDQMHWFVTCTCGHQMYMDFEQDDHIGNHYVDEIKRIYACGKCHQEILDEARRMGEWVAKYPDRKRRGYWISNLMAPWVSADRILEQKSESSIDFFYNFVLGKAYQPSEFLINRDAIMRANHPALADKSEVIIGCDSGKTKHYVVGNEAGVFNYGKTEDWDDIERMLTMYNATCVIDALPDFTVPERLAKKYRGKVFVHYYVHDTKNFEISKRKEGIEWGVIQSDRTKLFDQLAADIANKAIKFYQQPADLTELIYHFENMYRLVETDNRGIDKARWDTKENKPDHWAHAMAYYKVGQMIHTGARMSGGVRTSVMDTRKPVPGVFNDRVKVSEALGMDLGALVEKSLRINKGKRKVL